MNTPETPKIPDTADELVSKIDEAQPIGDAIKNADVGLINSARRGSEALAEMAGHKQVAEAELPGPSPEDYAELKGQTPAQELGSIAVGKPPHDTRKS